MTDKIEITQADRDAAASLARDIGEPGIADAILAGKRDPYTWCQHFARHRAAGRQQAIEEAEQAIRRRIAELTGDRRLDDELRFELNTAIGRIRTLAQKDMDR